MKSYKVEIREILSLIVDIEANSEEEAIGLVTKNYDNQEYVLTNEHYIDTEFQIYEE